MPVGFEYAYTIGGGDSWLKEYTVADAVVLSKGELCNLETGELTTAVTADTALVGAAAEAVDNTDDGETCRVYSNPDNVYRVTDANARVAGALLDIGTGGLTVGAASNNDLIVVEDSTATEPTLVMFAGSHFLQI